MQLVTKEQAMSHLRLDEEPPDLDSKIAQASAIIVDYLKIDPAEVEASPGPWTDVQEKCVEAAVLLALEAIFDAAPDRTIADYLNPQRGTIALLLMRLRDPAVA